MPTTDTAVQVAENPVIATRLTGALRRSVSSPQILELILNAIETGHRSVRVTIHIQTPADSGAIPQRRFLQGMTAVQFCKGLNGVNLMQVGQFLKARRWLYNESKTGTRWRVASYARDKYMTERQTWVTPDGEEPFIAYTPVLLHKGAMRLYQLYMAGRLPMKKSWDGQRTRIEDAPGEGLFHRSRQTPVGRTV